MKRIVAAVGLAAALGCGRSHAPTGIPPGDGPLVATYRATISESGGRARHAKVLLWAADPDRLHVELLSPVGGVRFTLDAGGGRACVVDVAARAAYVGDAGPEAVAALVGIPASIDEAVAALLRGAASATIRVSRREGPRGELPSALTIEDGRFVLGLERVRLERAGTVAGALGSGTPPAGIETRPLADLPAGSADGDAAAGGGR